MRISEWKGLVTPLLPAEQEWQFHGRSIVHRLPVGRFLFGVLAEASSAKNHRYIWRLAMPMFIPAEVVTLSYSDRIGGGTRRFDLDDRPAVSSAISEAIATLPTEHEALARIVELGDEPTVRGCEGAVYASVYLGDLDRAATAASIAASIEDRREWALEVQARIAAFITRLDSFGRAEAVSFLDDQAHATAQALKLRTA